MKIRYVETITDTRFSIKPVCTYIITKTVRFNYIAVLAGKYTTSEIKDFLA